MSVVWRRLTLAGFGRFHGPVTIDLVPGLNVLVAPNERGKSTLLAGLAAVLFGLPAVADESQFGQGKLRHWKEPLRFDGEVEFARHDQVYRVIRQFASHRVTVSRQGRTGWEDIVSGEHNPRARRRHQGYEEFLHDVLGIDRIELFWSAFALSSPLPEGDELDAHVQQLVAGAGSSHYSQALERLQKATFSLTKGSKELGVADRDRVKDGILENLIAEEQTLAEGIASSRQAVDEQQQLQRQLAESDGARRRAGEDRRRTEQALAAWTTWQDGRTARQRALRNQSQTLQVWEKYKELVREYDAEANRQREAYPEFVDAPADTGQRLTALANATAEWERRRAEARAIVGAVVARAKEELDAWRDFTARRATLEAKRRQLADEFVVFEGADEGARRLYARFDAERARLARAVEKARLRAAEEAAAAARREEESRRREAARSRFAAEYADVLDLDEEAALEAIAVRRRALHRREQLLAQQAALFHALGGITVGEGQAIEGSGALADGAGSRRAWSRPVLAGGGLAAAALAVVVYALGGGWWALGVFLLGAGAAAVLAAGSIPIGSPSGRAPGREAGAGEALQRQAAQLRTQLAEVEAALAPDPRLGAFAGADAHELGILAERLAARRQAAAALEMDSEPEPIPTPEGRPKDPEGGAGPDRVSAAAVVAEAEQAEAAFLAQTEPAVAAFGVDGVLSAFEAWSALRQEVDRLEDQLQSWVRARFGPKGGLYPEKVRVRPSPVLARLESGAEAAASGPALRWRQWAQIALTMGEGQEDGEPGDDAGVEVETLLGCMAIWSDMGSGDVAEAVAARELVGPESDAALRALRAGLETVLDAAGGDPVQAVARWQQFQQSQGRLQGLRAQQAGLLEGQGVSDADSLHMRIVDYGNQAEAARRQLEELSAQHPELPPPDAADDGAAAAEALARLRRQLEEERVAEEAAAEQYRALLNRQAALAGAPVINIAAAELELTQLQEQRRRVAFEIEATALAYRELAAAAEEYEQTYRQQLAERASGYVRRFTGRSRSIVLDEQFRVKIQDPDGPVHGVAMLSQGARDQLYLALRLAVADLVAEAAPLPLLLDDPFVHCDAQRLERIREALDALVQTPRQILLFSHRAEFAKWGHPITPQGEGWDVL